MELLMIRWAPLPVVALLALGGCDPFAFDDLEDTAPVPVLEAPESYPLRGFPKVLTAFSGSLDGAPASRLAASGGTDSPFVVYRAWSGGEIVLGDPLYDGCDESGECDDGAGASIAGVPVWRAGSPDEGRMCVLVGAPTAGTLLVRCESGGGVGGGERFTGPSAVRFGASAVGIGPDNPVGVALLGAPDAAGGAGALYRVPDGSGPVAISDAALDAALLPAGRLGLTLAASRLPTGETLVAAGAPRDPGEVGTRRVVVLVLADAGGGAVDVTVRACLDSEDEGWASALAWGDLDGDSLPELIVGRDARGVVVYDGAGLPDPGACADWTTDATRELACPAAAREGLASCDGASFGAAIATGDVNADGRDDLLVGAPDAAVDGVGGAGAVFLFPGTEDGPDEGGADVLAHSTPEANDHLGRPLATVLTDLEDAPRAEPVAGAPGRDATAVFLCTGLQGDTPAIGTRCLPR